eukprot:maker-scaffold_6-snap-gene-19.45-mRNA-1 protein AED:0.00 eAED:0.00 QI:87/1/1/1/1/1/2/95/335
MFPKLYKSRSRTAILSILRTEIKHNLNELQQGKIRVPKIANTFEKYLGEEPEIVEEDENWHIGKNFNYAEYYKLSNDKSWRIWYKWAHKFNEDIKKQTQSFAQTVFESGAYHHSELNREGVNHVLDVTYLTALMLRITSTLVYDCLSLKERQEASRCHLTAVLKNSVNSVRDIIASEHGIDLDIYLDPSVYSLEEKDEVIFVKSQLRYVLAELLKNSSKSMIKRYGLLDVHEAKPISIFFRKVSSGLILDICDEGVGMTREEIDLARGYFYTTDDLESKVITQDTFGAPFTGIGFGIPRCNTYLTFNGARLLISSKGKNEGVKYSIFLSEENFHI